MKEDFLEQQIAITTILFQGVLAEHAKDQKAKLETNFDEILKVSPNFPGLLIKIAGKAGKERVELINKLLKYLTSYNPEDKNSIAFKKLAIYYLNIALSDTSKKQKTLIERTLYKLADIMTSIGALTELSDQNIINTDQKLYQYYIAALKKTNQWLEAITDSKTILTEEAIAENLILIKDINAFAYQYDPKEPLVKISTPQQEILNSITILQKQIDSLPKNSEIIDRFKQLAEDLIEKNIKLLKENPRNVTSSNVRSIDNAIKSIQACSSAINIAITDINKIIITLDSFPQDSSIKLCVNKYINEAIKIIKTLNLNDHFIDQDLKKANAYLIQVREILSLSDGIIDREVVLLKKNINDLVINFKDNSELNIYLDALLKPARNFIKKWEDNFESVDLDKIKENYSKGKINQVQQFLSTLSFEDIKQKMLKITKFKLYIMQLFDEDTGSIIINNFIQDIAIDSLKIDTILSNMEQFIKNKESEKSFLEGGIKQLHTSFEKINTLKNDCILLCKQKNKETDFKKTVGELKKEIISLNESKEITQASENLVELLNRQILDIENYKKTLEKSDFGFYLWSFSTNKHTFSTSDMIAQGILLLDKNPETNTAFIEFSKSTKPYPTMDEKKSILGIISKNLATRKKQISEIENLNEKKYSQYFDLNAEQVKINKLENAPYLIKTTQETLNKLTIAINAYQKTLKYCFGYIFKLGANKRELERQKTLINDIMTLTNKVQDISIEEKLIELEKIRTGKQAVLKVAGKYQLI